MFEVNKHKTLLKDFHKIDGDRQVLFNDGDNDIIFTGENRYQNRLLCFIMFEDDENEFLRYIHLLVSEKQYSDFINQVVSLRSILETNEAFFIVDLDYGLNEIDHNIVRIDDIPSDFLPLENSYCPDFIKESSFAYSVSLLGGLADSHRAEANELADVSTRFSDFLKSSTAFLEDLKLQKNIYVEGLKAGSFKINFRIDIQESEQTNIINSSTDRISDFLSNYFKYFFNTLPNENDAVFKSETVESEDFQKLEKELEVIYNENYVRPESGVEQKLIDLLNYSASQIEEIGYDGSFKELKFGQTNFDNSDIPFGVIDSTFSSSIKDKLFDVSKFEAEPIIHTDENQREYKFQVYQFNTNSGNGSAYFSPDKDEVIRISVRAKGRDNYKNTYFTKSMDEGKALTFKGIGEYKDGVLKKVTCEI